MSPSWPRKNKWQLGHGTEHDPCGLDEWIVLQDQGPYWNPAFMTNAGERAFPGYTTDVRAILAGHSAAARKAMSENVAGMAALLRGFLS